MDGKKVLESLLKCKALMDSEGVSLLRIRRYGSKIVE